MKVFRYALVPDGMGTESTDEAFAVEGDEENVADPRPLLHEGFTSTIELPVGAEIIYTWISSRGLTLYALVNPENDVIKRTFFVCTNGTELPFSDVDELKAAQMHVGTFKVPGDLTAHVFETTQVLAEA